MATQAPVYVPQAAVLAGLILKDIHGHVLEASATRFVSGRAITDIVNSRLSKDGQPLEEESRVRAHVPHRYRLTLIRTGIGRARG